MSEPFTRTVHRLDGPGPFGSMNCQVNGKGVEYMARPIYSTAHREVEKKCSTIIIILEAEGKALLI